MRRFWTHRSGGWKRPIYVCYIPLRAIATPQCDTNSIEEVMTHHVFLWNERKGSTGALTMKV